MFCGNCGAVCPDGTSTCPSCGGQLPPTIPPPVNPYNSPYDAPTAGSYAANLSGPKPDNYLVYSILTTIFTTLCCCLPLGIVPLIYSIQVDNKWKVGDMNGALACARNAKIWNWVCVGFILLRFVLTVGGVLVSILLDASR